MKTSSRFMAATVLVAVFVAGLAGGVGLAPFFVPRPEAPAPLAGLDLTREQEERGRAIIASHRGELESVLGELRPRVQAIHKQIRTELNAILTPEQRDRLDALEKVHGGPHTEGGPQEPPWPPH